MTTKSAAAAARATVYGYPRQGANRELKKAVEGYWKGRVTASELRATAAELRRATWHRLAGTGLHEVPTGDFSYYDHVLDTTVMVGAIPDRHRAAVAADPLDGYFAMARGTQQVAPLEMTKWFDTNYHYLVPELGPDTVFTADSAKQVAELTEALALGLSARPVLVGPVTYLLLAKPAPGVPADFEPLTLLDRLLPVYAEILADLRAAGADWVQLDEPALVQDRTPAELNAAARAYRDLGALPDDTTTFQHSSDADYLADLAALSDTPAERPAARQEQPSYEPRTERPGYEPAAEPGYDRQPEQPGYDQRPEQPSYEPQPAYGAYDQQQGAYTGFPQQAAYGGQDPYGYQQQADPYTYQSGYVQQGGYDPQQQQLPQASQQAQPQQDYALDETSLFDTGMISAEQLRAYEQGRGTR